MSTFKLGTGFGLFKKQTTEVEEIINDSMMLDELKTETRNNIISIFNSIKNYETFEVPDEYKMIESSLDELKKGTENELFGPLTSLATKIDNGFKAITDLDEELRAAKTDLGNASHVRVMPTNFLQRFVKNIRHQFKDLAINIAGVQNMPIFSETKQSNHVISDVLQNENKALIRLSTKMTHVRRKYEVVRQAMLDKLNLTEEKAQEKYDRSRLSDKEIQNYVEGIRSQYDQYIREKNSKMDKWLESIDLFGTDMTQKVESAKTTMFGKGFGSTFANKPLTTTTSATNRPKSGAPPPATGIK